MKEWSDEIVKNDPVGNHKLANSVFTSLLSLANPLHSGNPQEVGAEIDWWEILRLADINRVLLLLYRNLQPRRGFIPNSVWTGLEREATLRLQVWNVISSELDIITSRLDDAGLRWILIKTVRGFPREIRDLDILVFDNQVKQLKSLLGSVGYVQSGKLSGFKLELKTYKKTNGGRRVPVALDVHTRISYEGLTFVDEERIWKSHREVYIDKIRVPVPSNEHQVITTVLNSFFGDGGIRLTDVIEFGGLLSGGVRLDEPQGVAKERGWTLALREFVEKTRPYLRVLGFQRASENEIEDAVASLSPLPDTFDKGVLLKALLEKAGHDFGRADMSLVPSWGRIGMKFASRMSRGHICRDSWNGIFQR